MDALITKINNVDKLTQSQTDRLNLQLQVENDLIKFIQIQIKQVTEHDSLYALALKAATDKLQEEMESGLLNWGALLKIIETLGKNKNEVSLGLMDIIKGNQKMIIEHNTNFDEKQAEKENLPSVSNEEYSKMKKFIEIFDNVKKSEFSKNE